MKNLFYFDNSATTQLDPQVLEMMMPYLTDLYGNPSSNHHFSIPVKNAIKKSRVKIAETLGVDPTEIIFTSGGTESNNMALVGACRALSAKGKHIITSKAEHKSILECCAKLQQIGYEVTYLDVQKNGSVDPRELKKNLRADTILVSIMTANNEVGTITEIETIASIVHSNGTLFHTDAVQAYGHIPVSQFMKNVDLLSASGHKFHGPKGVGFLYKKREIPLAPLICGGGQEMGLRSGTENVASIVGLACAASMMNTNMQKTTEKVHFLRSHIINRILSEIPESFITGDVYNRLPNHASFCFANINSVILVDQLSREKIFVSSGSACSNNGSILKPSHVLVAMGIPENLLFSSIRISVSENNTLEEVNFLVDTLKKKIYELREWN